MTTFIKNTNSFTKYLNMIGEYPIMEKSEIYHNFEQYEKTQDNSYIQTIIMHHLRYVVHIARQYQGYKLPLYDLVQEGNIGLMKGIKKFDYLKAKSNDVGLTSFVVHDIKGHILDYIVKNIGLIHKFTCKDHRKIFFNRTKFNSYPRPLTEDIIKSISDDLNLKTEHSVLEMEERLHSRTIQTHEDDNDSFKDQDGLQLQYENDNPLDILLYDEEQKVKQDTLASLKKILTDREYDILDKRFLSDEKSTLHELSLVHNVSKERIRQIEKNTIEKMRRTL